MIRENKTLSQFAWKLGIQLLENLFLLTMINTVLELVCFYSGISTKHFGTSWIGFGKSCWKMSFYLQHWLVEKRQDAFS